MLVTKCNKNFGRRSVVVETYFPIQFEAVRFLYTKGRPTDLIYSLLRSAPFKTTGGKKGKFHRSLDDKLLLKEIEFRELQAFVSRLSSGYFLRMMDLYSSEDPSAVPSVLCKSWDYS